MITCIACSRQLNDGSLHQREREEDDAMETPRTKQAIKAITAQVFTYFLKLYQLCSLFTY